MKPQTTRLLIASCSFVFYVGLPGESLLLPSADSAVSEMHAALHEGSAVADEEGDSEDSEGGGEVEPTDGDSD